MTGEVERRLCSAAAVALVAGVIAGCFGPMAGSDAALLQLPTMLALAVAIAAYQFRVISASGFLSTAAFLGLHTVASYYGYCNVPYDDWTEQLFGRRMSDRFGWERNHFDRLVHLAYGFCLLIPARQAAERLLGLRGVAATAVAVQFVFATSMIYELGEWLVAIVAAPETAERYNGQQGDVWDAQKDMALAAAGSLAVVLLSFRSRDAERG